MVIFLSIFTGLMAIICIVYVINNNNKEKNIIKVGEKFKDKGFTYTRIKNKAFDLILKKDGEEYYVKVIFNPREDEININSKYYFQINHGVVSSRKKGEKLEKVYDLIDLNQKNKIYVIYPGSKRLMKVINECEMIFIDDNTDIYGTKMYQFKNM